MSAPEPMEGEGQEPRRVHLCPLCGHRNFDDDRLLTAGQAAKLLGISRRTLLDRTKAGIIPALDLPYVMHHRYRAGDLVELVVQRKPKGRFGAPRDDKGRLLGA